MQVQIHAKKNSTDIWFTFAFFILFCYGFYKNGILPFQYQAISLFHLFTPIFELLFSLLLFFFLDKVLKKEKLKESRWWEILFIGIVTPPRMAFWFPPILYVLLTYLWEKKNWFVNKQALFCAALFLGMLGKENLFANALELQNNFSYSLFDQFFGHSLGSYGLSSFFLLLVFYGTQLLWNPYYKKNLSILLFVVFASILSLRNFLFPILEENFIDGTFLFLVLFVSTISMYSPMTKKGTFYYVLALGIFTCILDVFFVQSLAFALSLSFISFFVKKMDSF